jgi:endonuclease/exonuclease/phosphatase family metal-dependent hydrolase
MNLAQKESNMKIVTYNLNQGGPSDRRSWANVLEAFDPDIFLAQESRRPEDYGLPQLIDQTAWRQVNKRCGASRIRHSDEVERIRANKLLADRQSRRSARSNTSRSEKSNIRIASRRHFRARLLATGTVL